MMSESWCTLSRRQLLSMAAVACALPRKLPAADLSGFYYRDYSKCLPDYLTALAHAAYEKRNHELSLLTNAESIRKRQDWVRETFWKLIGGELERTPLNPRKTGDFDRPGYRLEKVVYESRPDLFVTANLYVPTTRKPPYPGILFQMGHSGLGKAYPSYQKCCQGLARLGYVVLAFDPMGQGERIAYLDSSGVNTRLPSIDAEHSVPGKQFLLLGDTSSRYQLWDAIRSLDYLAGLPYVDPQRQASVGQSGGATLTMLLACADSRLAAAAVCSGNTENVACANFDPPGSTDDAEQDLINSGPIGFDRWDLLYPIAPKPLLIQVSAHDFYGTYSPRYLSDGREEYEKLLKCYDILGHADHLGWSSTPLPHSLSYSLRLSVYNWFEKWLKKSDQQIREEPHVAPETEQTLWVGPTGNVTRDFKSLRPIDFIKRQASATSSSEPASSWTTALGLRMPERQLSIRKLARTPTEAASIEAIEVQSAPSVWLPGWLFTPEQPDNSRGPLLVLDDHGRNSYAGEDGVYHRIAQSGRVVLAADIRGMGDTRPEVGRGNPAYTIPHDSEEEFAWASLILGDSLLAQRIQDILAIAQAMRNESAFGNAPLSLAARGRLAVPALFAFAASPHIGSLYLVGGLVSYRSILDTENYRQPLSVFAWDLFRVTDLPKLAVQANPRRIHLAGTVDAANDRVDPNVLRNLYPGKNVEISEEPNWEENALKSA
jgi:dienelactone hydrolase